MLKPNSSTKDERIATQRSCHEKISRYQYWLYKTQFAVFDNCKQAYSKNLNEYYQQYSSINVVMLLVLPDSV